MSNNFWIPSKPRRDPVFESPDELWRRACEYFAYIKENPLYEEKAFQFQGQVVKDTVEKHRAMTITGLCIHFGCDRSTYENYRKREGYAEVCALVDDIIITQKVELAAADLLNAGFIAKELGMRERVEQSGSVTHINYSPEDYKRAQKELESKLDGLD
jgi:hypothetical protein